MIFNTIDKHIRNFVSSPDHLQKKCSISYQCLSQSNTVYKQNQQCGKSFGRNYDKNIVRQCIPFNQTCKVRPLKSLSADKTVPMAKSVKKQNKNDKKLLHIDKNRRQRYYFKERCHPQRYQNSQGLSRRSKDSRKNIQLQKIGIANHLNRSKHNKNLELLSPEISRREKDNQLSQTAVSMGSQLYQLSPIHFNKYMHYRDRLTDYQQSKNNIYNTSQRKKQQKQIQTQYRFIKNEKLEQEQKQLSAMRQKLNKQIQDEYMKQWNQPITMQNIQIFQPRPAQQSKLNASNQKQIQSSCTTVQIIRQSHTVTTSYQPPPLTSALCPTPTISSYPQSSVSEYTQKQKLPQMIKNQVKVELKGEPCQVSKSSNLGMLSMYLLLSLGIFILCFQIAK